MGLETSTTVHWKGRSRRAKVHLDGTHLRVSGPPPFSVALDRIRDLEVADGELRLDTGDGRMAIVLGPKASVWLARIRSPPSRATKLGLQAGQAVYLRGVADPSLLSELGVIGATMKDRRATGSLDLVFLGVTSPSGLAELPALRMALRPDGAIWVIREKGKAAPVPEAAVRAAAKEAGLVDVKVVAFSGTHTAEKLVIPLVRR